MADKRTEEKLKRKVDIYLLTFISTAQGENFNGFIAEETESQKCYLLKVVEPGSIRTGTRMWLGGTANPDTWWCKPKPCHILAV